MADVHYALADRVATITIDHPPANLLTSGLIARLEAAIDTARAEASVKVVVIAGAGGSFVAGADIKEIAAISGAQHGASLARRGQALFDKIEKMDKPVIAALTGFCLGGGMELAMACHLRIAGDRVKMGQPEINLGIIPGFGGTQRLPRIVGAAKAMELILTGDLISASEAKAIGLVNQIVPEGDVLQRVQGLAKKIASKGAKAIAAVCETLQAGLNVSPTGFAYEAEQFGKLCETADMKEGLSAFLEKRQPKFTDR